jgi:endonuclease/exonuclease/phosphatase (EEP) superfamily protein YafD
VGVEGGDNPHRLEALAAHLTGLKIPFILGGDWNATPQEMVAFASFIKGAIITPSNVAFTCTSGAGRMLDYVIVANSLASQVEVTADMKSP